MMQKIQEKDWKLFRKKVPAWQEAYMERLCEEYVALLTSDANASDRFWKLEKKIREDRKKTGVLIEMSRSMMVDNMISMLHERAITMEDLDDFSDDVRETVRMFVRL